MNWTQNILLDSDLLIPMYNKTQRNVLCAVFFENCDILISEDPAVRTRLTECLETILNKAQEPPKSKKIQHGNAKNAVLNEAINLIIHMDSDPNLLVRACNQLGQFLQHRETNLR